jgi:diacylglycerol kinase (ATP)
MEQPRFNIANRIKAFGYALSGFADAIKTQHALWIQCSIAAVIVATGFYFHVSAQDWRWLVIAITMVVAAEIMNTALEFLCDAVHPDYNLLIGRAKDAAAGAVLAASIGAVTIGLITLWPYLF